MLKTGKLPMMGGVYVHGGRLVEVSMVGDVTRITDVFGNVRNISVGDLERIGRPKRNHTPVRPYHRQKQ